MYLGLGLAPGLERGSCSSEGCSQNWELCLHKYVQNFADEDHAWGSLVLMSQSTSMTNKRGFDGRGSLRQSSWCSKYASISCIGLAVRSAVKRTIAPPALPSSPGSQLGSGGYFWMICRETGWVSLHNSATTKSWRTAKHHTAPQLCTV